MLLRARQRKLTASGDPTSVRSGEGELRRSVCMAIASLALAACSDSTGPESVAGRYELVSINGDPLPFVFFQRFEEKIEFTAGHIQLNSDLTCNRSFTIRTTTDGEVTTDTATGTCTWTQNDTAISVTFSEFDIDVGSLIDGNLALASLGLALLYQR